MICKLIMALCGKKNQHNAMLSHVKLNKILNRLDGWFAHELMRKIANVLNGRGNYRHKMCFSDTALGVGGHDIALRPLMK